MKSNISLMIAVIRMVIVMLGLTELVTPYAQAQTCPLKMMISYEPVQQLTLADIDFEHFQSRNLLFSISISSTTEIPVDAKIEGNLNMDLADGTRFDNAVTFRTTTFQVPPSGKIITNQNIGRGSDIGIEQFHFEHETAIRLALAKCKRGLR